MTNQATKSTTFQSRVYKNQPKFLGIEMGKSSVSWIKAFPHNDGILIESCCIDGNVVLSPEHARLLSKRLLEWSKTS